MQLASLASAVRMPRTPLLVLDRSPTAQFVAYMLCTSAPLLAYQCCCSAPGRILMFVHSASAAADALV
eukprot:1605949-Amphidinium_carterae.1